MKFIAVAQTIGIAAMLANVLSYQAKKQKNLIIMQFFGSLLFAVNMFMLGAYTGAILNTVGIVRAVVYSNKNRIKKLGMANTVFISIYILSYILSFTVLGMSPTPTKLIIEVLPVIAMIATTVSFAKKSAADVRRLAFVSSPLWLVYNCINLSIGGIICEVLSLISLISAVLRLDAGEKNKGGSTENEQ